MKDKIFVLDNSDKRMNFLKNYLVENSFLVMDYNFAEIKTEMNLIYVFSPAVLIDKEIIKTINPYSVVYGFKIDSDLNELLSKKHITFYNFLFDELFCHKNAMLTAEGLLGIIIGNTELAFKEMKVLLLGYGRTGKSIEHILTKLDIDIITVTTDDMEQSLSKIYSKTSIDFSSFYNYLDKVNIIINTIPALVLDKKEIDLIDANAVVFDISTNLGINIDYAKKRGIKVLHPLSIPAKHSPSMAGKLLFDKIMGIK